MDNFTLILERAYQQNPDRTAIRLLFSRQPDQILTYRQLLHKAAIYMDALQSAGIQPGEVVILILQHGEDLVASFFGAILLGAIPSIMPFLTDKLLPEQYRAALSALFDITQPAAIVTYADFTEEAHAASEGSSVRAILNSERIKNHAAPNQALDFTQMPGRQSAPNEIVLLQHSSGTTGLQKGVALSHQAVFNQLASYTKALRLNSGDRIVSWLPLYHDMGLIAGFILPILEQIPLILISPFDWVRAPQRLLKAISDYRGTLCWLPNFAYNFSAQKIRSADLEGVELSSLRAVINCSEPMYLQSHTMFLERFQPYGLRPEALATCYAMAENVFAVTQGGIDSPVAIDWIDRRALLEDQFARPISQEQRASDEALPMLSAGKPIQSVQLRILDEQWHDLPERRVGEIALRSHCMLSGYYHRPDLTEKALREGWYLTGDLGYLADGELYITGRKKDLIIVGGKNIYPQDLERLASEVPGVHPGRTVAFGVFNQRAGTEDVVIIAETDIQRTADDRQAEENAHRTDQITAEIRRRVTRGSDIALRYVYLVARNWLVKTSSGKIARSANREKFLAEFNSFDSAR